MRGGCMSTYPSGLYHSRYCDFVWLRADHPFLNRFKRIVRSALERQIRSVKYRRRDASPLPHAAGILIRSLGDRRKGLPGKAVARIEGGANNIGRLSRAMEDGTGR